MPTNLVSSVVRVAAAAASAALDGEPCTVPLSTAPEAGGSVSELTQLPLASRIAFGSVIVWVAEPGGLTSTIPPVKSRRSRLLHGCLALVASPRLTLKPCHQLVGVCSFALTASLPVEISK